VKSIMKSASFWLIVWRASQIRGESSPLFTWSRFGYSHRMSFGAPAPRQSRET